MFKFITHGAMLLALASNANAMDAMSLSDAELDIIEAVVQPRASHQTNYKARPVSNVERIPYSKKPRKNYGVKLNNCRAALIDESWVLTAKHCITWKKMQNPRKRIQSYIYYYDESGQRKQFRQNAQAVYRHAWKDVALIHLAKPIPSHLPIEPAALLFDPIVKKHGMFRMKKVSAPAAWRDIPVRSGRKNNAYVSKGQRRGKAGTSGSPWVFESRQAGDVIFGVTHGSGRAPQLAYVRDWINGTVKKHDPNATLYWVRLRDVFPGRF